ncbi:MAG: alpha/beta hydrolase family protein [Gemmatimonadaceae bacterium]
MNEWRIGVGDQTTRAVYEPATAGDEVALYVMAHGAGGSMADRAMLAAANALRARGIGVVRFNFLYKERGSSRPDPIPKCQSVIEAVVARARSELSPKTLIIGGRSFGGRAASMLAADGFDAKGLLLLAYPLHLPGRPEKLRDEHLPRITMPVICFNGTRDNFCTPAIMKRVLGTVTAPWEMHWLEGADHSFHVLKSSGRTDADVVTEMAGASARWAATLQPANGHH